ncbi:hypothetical protein [Azospirillum sp. TSA6c]|uniref:hypothetical protein n=1 Tax=Azospirillum sp. TSA6c TaxID=709813 RepID=UPI0011B5D680|nr:hypothetical protein [Azospirillum sp. TSA6c]
MRRAPASPVSAHAGLLVTIAACLVIGGVSAVGLVLAWVSAAPHRGTVGFPFTGHIVETTP